MLTYPGYSTTMLKDSTGKQAFSDIQTVQSSSDDRYVKALLS